MRALSIAATGMSAQQTNVEVIANNVANINTTGFKRSRAEFTDLLYETERAAGTVARDDETIIPEGNTVGLGVRTVAIRNLHVQGALAPTSNRYDLALSGMGWFQIQGENNEILYTRAGAFNKNANGQLVTLEGNLVVPEITVPDTASDVMVNQVGQVYAIIGATGEQQLLGQLTLAKFANETGLAPLGGNLFRETVASGDAVIGSPGDAGYAKIQQGYLENSNVDPVKEITELIAAQRAYEMNSKVISAADSMFSTITRDLR
ncbi:flagellar basal-body rod protein FlgG [Hyphomicrobium methylovorum]|uniref:flagellar basal-body rod protein FlgG n=1 Tax=Hyphomicrobium methylovorum TaxID=84 RepID=UPI0015E63D4C|nr:flagellar basal-body rod protein FlgG [Hyphomicrobium methylovorum]MBA2125953.1 flagellar basal-body rod protein FlgG [Hyphomicrobium methylovorum]